MNDAISRRSFLRCAGAAALAAAASAMLAGCGSKTVTVYFYDDATGNLLETREVGVEPDATTVTWEDLRCVLPSGYEVYRGMQGDAGFIRNSQTVRVFLTKSETTVTVIFYNSKNRNQMLSSSVIRVDAGASYVTWEQVAGILPAGYEHYADRTGRAGRIGEDSIVKLYLNPQS